MIGGLLVAIAALLFMILKTRIPAFPALIIAAVITGSLGGMKSEMMIASVTRGFGGTLGNIGIVIGFGVMMGSLLQMSGPQSAWRFRLSTCWARGARSWRW